MSLEVIWKSQFLYVVFLSQSTPHHLSNKKLASLPYLSTKTYASKFVPRKRSSAPPPYVVFFDPFYPLQGSRSGGAGAALGAEHC